MDKKTFWFLVFLALLLASAETTEGIVSSFELPADGVAAVVLWLTSSVLKITVVFWGLLCSRQNVQIEFSFMKFML